MSLPQTPSFQQIQLYLNGKLSSQTRPSHPSHGSGTLNYFLPVESDVKFEFVDVFGRELNRIIITDKKAGNYSIPLLELAPGSILPDIYFIRMSACGNVSTLKVIITE